MKTKSKSVKELIEIIRDLHQQNKTVVFTNGVFDILHPGHVEYLAEARTFGDVLILGLNSDSSVKRIKGNSRPIVAEQDRIKILSALEMIDYICLFSEDTPQTLIEQLIPDVLVKGGDYKIEEIVGREVVEKNGGKILTIPLTEGKSTTNIIEKIRVLVREGKL